MKMKTSRAMLLAGLFAMVAVSGAASAYQVRANTAAAQTVTISAKRMTIEEKRAFDLQSSGFQTVVISAKRLTPEQKAAMEKQDREWQADARK
jgi:hypothetical protein